MLVMLAENLKSELHKLNRVDKLRVVQLIIDDLALEEEFNIVSGAQYEVWSPYDAAEAATILTKLLNEDESKPDHA
jgi:hypothetical protein